MFSTPRIELKVFSFVFLAVVVKCNENKAGL